MITIDELAVVLRPVMPAAAVRKVQPSRQGRPCSFVLSETLYQYRSWLEAVLEQAETEATARDRWREPDLEE